MKKQNLITLAIIGLLVAMTAYTAMAVPVIPNSLNSLNSTRRTIDSTNKTDEAIAGNVTELLIDNTQVTQGWQGYYGNVTGTIVLDDAASNSLYTWAAAGEGEVYASRNFSIDWSSGQIVCLDVGNISIENTELFPGTSGDDVDNFTSTFSETTHPAIIVGANSFTADECSYSIATYVDDAVDADRTFNETLLFSKSHNGIIYTAILNDDSDGFKNNDVSYDFQMIVGEDGHSGDTSTTTYYFYVELVG